MMFFWIYSYYTEGGVFVSKYVSKEFRVHQTPSSSILLVKMLAKTDVVSKTVSYVEKMIGGSTNFQFN